MTLFEIQEMFNANFDIEHLKHLSEEGLKSYLDNHEFVLSEFKTYLSQDVRLGDLYGEYSYVQIFINKANSIPFFRIRYIIKLKGEELPKFWYETEFDTNGNMLDDYFDTFLT